MMKLATKVLVGFGLALSLSSAAGAQVTLSPGAQTGEAGSVVNFDFGVTGDQAAATAVARFRLALDPATAVIEPVLRDEATGEVDCSIASDLSAFVTTGPVFYQPNNKRVVIGFGDFAAPVQAFGRSGTILSCKFRIKAGTANGTYPLECSGNPTASTAGGASITSTCTNGELTVTGGGTTEPTPTATLPSNPVILSPGNHSVTTGQVGTIIELPFAVEGASAAQVAVARFRLALDPATSVLDPVLKDVATGEVDCTVATDLAGFVTTGPVFYQPNNKRVVIGFGDFAAPVQAFGRSGTILTCKFTLKAGTAPGQYLLECSGAPTASSAAGAALDSACVAGALNIGGGIGATVTPTATPTASLTPTDAPSATPSFSPTNTPAVTPPTNTPTRTSTRAASATHTPQGQVEDEDGCQLSASNDGHISLVWLAGAAGLLLIRRRRR